VRKKRSVGAIELVDSGFSLREEQEGEVPPIGTWPWSSVNEVKAFKRDLLFVDLICLRFSMADGSSVELNEEMVGFDSLVAAMPSQLSGCPTFEEWWHPVAVPAFSPNERVLYVR
jgi:hypothetical protein